MALLSDVHSNLPALEAVLRHLGRPDGSADCACGGAAPVDAIWCLGDTVGYNANPAECLRLVQQHASVVLLGNHDWATLTQDVDFFNPNAAAGVAFARRELGRKDLEYLQSLRPSLRTADALLAHASPDDPLWEYVDRASGHRYLERPDLPALVAFGHTHVPFVLETPDRIVANVGSVGQPRDGDPRATFLTVDLVTRAWTLHRVAYDVERAARAILDAGLPRALADRLFIGR